MQLVVLVGFDETLKQFDAGSQFSPALCVRRALGFVKDSHVRHIRDNVYAIADGRFDGVKLMMQCQVGTIRLQHQRVAIITVGFGERAVDGDRLAAVFER